MSNFYNYEGSVLLKKNNDDTKQNVLNNYVRNIDIL